MSKTPKIGLEGLLRPDNSILVLIDHQPYQFANLHSHEPTMIVNNVIGLAKTAKVFDVPTILTTSSRPSCDSSAVTVNAPKPGDTVSKFFSVAIVNDSDSQSSTHHNRFSNSPRGQLAPSLRCTKECRAPPPPRFF